MEFTTQQLLESIPLGVVVTGLDGNILTVNAALRDLVGLADADLVGQPLSSLSVEPNAFGEKAVLTDMAAGKKRSPYIDEFRTHSGESVAVEVHPSPMHDSKGGVGGALFAVKALSEEMRLLKTLQRRNMHLLASSEVARATTQILDAQEVLTRCVDLIQTHFGFYYAAVFLIDEAGEWAVLRAATGQAGQQLLAEKHKLSVGSQSMVGWVCANSAARIALDVGEEAIRFDNPLLSKTRSEMALPLRVRGDVIGALDVQSTSLNAFSEEDIQTIQMMADQVAIAIDNARLFARRGGPLGMG